ncbi:MAG: glycosyltransferase family 2 protein [Nitrosomonadales bacterium]|nr:glycosyltransferase family 2 protein [Nitrosomonadales bacterium]
MPDPTDKCGEVCAIFVCFHPEFELFRSAVEAMSGQAGMLVVVNNGAGAEVERWLKHSDYPTLNYPENIGVASAHNRGMEWAASHGASYVILMDQDSIAAPGMVSTLLASARQLRLDGVKFAAIGPRIVSMKSGESHPMIRLGLFSNTRRYDDTMNKAMEVDILISSGTLIPLELTGDIGRMNEDLFIDNVDMEWCFRARYKGYKLYIEPNAVLRHNLGDSTRKIRLLGNVPMILHGPVRLYYMMRNRILLYSLVHTPIIWVIHDIFRIIAKFLIFSVLIPPRGRNASMMLKGIADGIRGATGRYRN